MARAVIMGGNGYVGREVARLLHDSCEICVTDSLPSRFRPEELSNFRFERVDIFDAIQINELFSDFRPDVIIHLGAVLNNPELIENPARAVHTNLLGTMNVMLAAPAGCRLIYASSLFAQQSDLLPCQRTMPRIEPMDLYSFGNLAAEHCVRYFAARRGLSAVVVRMLEIDDVEMSSYQLLADVRAKLHEGRTVVRLGGRRVRDAARSVIEAALKFHAPPGLTLTVNLATRDLAPIAKRRTPHCGSPFRAVRASDPQHSPSWGGA
jgi:UDP-glucose 4-epimerase